MIHGIIPDPVNARLVLDVMLMHKIDESIAYAVHKELKEIERRGRKR